MPQITGKAIIKVDGNQWRTTDGCKLHPWRGGARRKWAAERSTDIT